MNEGGNEVAMELTKSRMDIIRMQDHIRVVETDIERINNKIQSLFSKIDASGDTFINAMAETAARTGTTITISFYPIKDEED